MIQKRQCKSDQQTLRNMIFRNFSNLKFFKNAEYDFQTMVYLLAVKEFFKAKFVVFVYLDLKNKTEVKIELTEERIKLYKEKLIQVADKINTSEFLKTKKDSFCENCEYKIICY
jgi:CRISPR/Cas system-associated exonuclease Cas4 (RecB family)